MAKTPERIHAGMQIHCWTVVSKLPDDTKTVSPNLRRRLRVQCVCGTRESIPIYYLTRKGPKEHCGCKNKGLSTLHKLEYRVWYMMNVRCLDSRHKNYMDYGGRGIKVCDRWIRTNPHGFANFLKDMGPRRLISLTLDRQNVNGMYEPKNCRWATWEVQNNNKRGPRPQMDIPPEEELGAAITKIDSEVDKVKLKPRVGQT